MSKAMQVISWLLGHHTVQFAQSFELRMTGSQQRRNENTQNVGPLGKISLIRASFCCHISCPLVALITPFQDSKYFGKN